jgi:hypothetical protein
MTHPAEALVSCCGDRVPIDVELVGIISALWAGGVHTTHCCQDHNDDGTDATIGFPGLADADRFLGLVRHGNHTLHAGKRFHHTQRRFVWWQWWFGRLDEDLPLARAPVTVFIPRGELGDVERYVKAAWAAEGVHGSPPSEDRKVTN